MLRYKTKTRPGLVALYDIQPGNGAGPFLQPRSPHGARTPRTTSSTVVALPLEIVYMGIASSGPFINVNTFVDNRTQDRCLIRLLC